jgi:hypothetical protein
LIYITATFIECCEANPADNDSENVVPGRKDAAAKKKTNKQMMDCTETYHPSDDELFWTFDGEAIQTIVEV